MSDLLTKMGPAILGLVGTLLVALLGVYQWRKTQDRAKRAEFIAAKRSAYEGLSGTCWRS
jgi:nicotinamide riboside transporter PnuC